MVDYEVHGHVGVLTLNRPEARNAVNDVVAQAMTSALEQMEADPDVWVGVLTANTTGHKSPVFCAGADLKMINSGRAGELATAKGGFGGFTTFPRTKPIIAAVDGLATAGGCEIALAADMIVASKHSQFGLAEVKRNLVAAAGGLYRLPKLIGKNVALEVALTGEPLTAQRAYELGLVNRLTENGAAFEGAMELANAIAANAPLAVWESRALVIAADWDDEATINKNTAAAFGRVLSSEDTTEGLTAFIEKRAPQWRGR
jgi:enoyl-CoA hydratase